MGGCFICDKHRSFDGVPGGFIVADALTVVSHLPLRTPVGTAQAVYLGYLFVEPRRHVAELGDLTAEEAASFGQLTAASSRALQAATQAEHVYAAVIGHGLEHLHMHLIPRYPNTPREFWWTRLDEWPDAPTGDAAAVTNLVKRITRLMEHTAPDNR